MGTAIATMASGRSKSMNKVREIIVTQTFNEMGVQIDLKTTPLVRCKDCKWRNKAGCALEIVDDSDKPSDNDYCSYGERKDNE